MTKAICVWYWFIFLPYLCSFLKNLCWTIYWWFCKQNITWSRRNMLKRKEKTVQSDTVGYYPRSKLPFRGIIVESRAYIRSELLTQWNAWCKTLNNDHYDNKYLLSGTAFHVRLLYDWLYQISASFSHFLPRQFSQVVWRNFYMNSLCLFTIVD